MRADVIHIINAENKNLYERELREHHRIRHEIYIEERNWRGLQSRDGLEFDDFDTAYMTYALAIDNDRVIGGARLYPTLQPHMLENVCPQLAEVKGIPRGPAIYEWTRLFVVSAHREGRYGGRVSGKILCGCVEHCLAEGINQLSLVFEAWWLPRMHTWGWKINPLGLPDLIDGEWWLAGLVEVDERMLAATRKHFGVTEPMMIRNGIAQRIAQDRVA
jgi:acyl-homoserine lactone synthase